MIPARYHLKETPTANYSQRTEWNVRDSEGTVVFSIQAELKGGSQETVAFARKHGKPLLHLCRASGAEAPELDLLRFIRTNRIRSLNVAGPRASEEPRVGTFVREVLEKMWAIGRWECETRPSKIQPRGTR